MKAVRIEAIEKLSVAEVPQPVAAAGEYLVELRAAALNHRDVWIKQGKYAGLRFPCIPGSDGAGVVTVAGPGADPAMVGRHVMINPSLGWGPSEAAQGPEFSILGLPRDGTLSQMTTIAAGQVTAKPDHLSWEEAAALPLAGLTAYRALFSRARLGERDRVLISGIGGGVALFAMQFAVACGNEVWVTSSSDEKIARAVSMGARGGFRYDKPEWVEEARKLGGFDVIVDGAAGPGFGALLDAAAAGGRIANYGATRAAVPELAMRKIFWRQLSILGSTMGSPADWCAMVAFVSLHRIKPVVSDLFGLDQAPEAFALMERGGQFGKIVVRM